jgi:putative hydrolase of the HAD superfamily
VRFDAVFFDVGNTLIRPEPSVGSVCAEVLRAAGHDRTLAEIDSLLPAVDAYYEERYQADDSFWTSDDGAADVWTGMYCLLCSRLGVPGPEAPVIAGRVYAAFGSAGRWRPFPDVVPALERLAASGVKVGVISNWDSRLASILDGIGLGRLIDTVVCSAAEGLHKPDPRIFEAACSRAGVRASRCAHVGDHVYADVIGARSAGMTPVLIDRHGPAAGGSESGVTRIATLDELEGVLS